MKAIELHYTCPICQGCRKIFKFLKDLQILVESMSWRDRNLKFGPNCDLEVDSLE